MGTQMGWAVYMFCRKVQTSNTSLKVTAAILKQKWAEKPFLQQV